MRFVTDARKCIFSFISHSEEDNKEAQYYKTLLCDTGFSAFQYGDGLRPADLIRDTLFEEINKSHFFLLIVSDYFLTSPWTQRELGLAVAIQKKNRFYKPIIVPLYAKNASWRKSGTRPSTFPTCDFETGESTEPFKLAAVRGLDKYCSPTADLDDVLISLMKPCLLVTRLDFQDEATLHDQQVFRLYENLFPPEERDPPEYIIRWVFRTDLGEERRILLRNGTTLAYKLDSRWFTLSLAKRAIGLAFTTFDHTTKLVYGNYIAVQECWRVGDMARAFGSELMKVFEVLFPEFQGIVFEVEKFDKGRVEGIINHLKNEKETGNKLFLSDDDRNEIRKFLRVCVYQNNECSFFLDGRIHAPLVCTSPSLDPTGGPRDWKRLEMDYWLMWYGRPGTPLDTPGAKTLWAKAIRCIYIEILAKSLVEASPDTGAEYWRHANAVVDRSLRRSQSKDITFGSLQDLGRLHRIWIQLNFEITI